MLAAIGVLCVAFAAPAAANGALTPPSEMAEVSLKDRAQRVHVYLPPGGASGAPILFVSGDGPWAWLPPWLCRAVADRGHVVVGLSGHDYLVHGASSSKPLTPERIQSDFRDLLLFASSRDPLHRKPFLIGWSLGAGYSIAAAAAPDVSARCAGVLLIGLSERVELAWRTWDALTWITGRDPNEPALEVRPFLDRLSVVPVCVIHGTTDRYAPFAVARQMYDAIRAPKRMVELPQVGHLFRSRDDRQRLLSAIADGMEWAEAVGRQTASADP